MFLNKTMRFVLLCIFCNSLLIAGSINKTDNATKEEIRLEIDFLYLNLSICERCITTDDVLDEALAEMKEDFRNVKELTVKKIKIENEDDAKKYNFIKSPTVRINGKDIEEILTGTLEIKDNYCQSCAKSCGTSQCRIFKYKGETYEAIPKEMIKEAIRKVLGITVAAQNIDREATQPTCCPSGNSCGDTMGKK